MESCFLREQKAILRKNWWECAKIQFSAHMQITDLLPTFRFPTPISHFHRNKYNVHSPFYPTTCGGKHALQLRFCTKPNSASYQKFPFRTGSKHGRAFCGTNKLLQKILMHWTFQISPIIPPHGFWTEVAGRSPVCFWLLFAEAKSNRKTVLLVLFAKSKKNVYCPLGKFSEKEKFP